jgi:hypothetical protein
MRIEKVCCVMDALVQKTNLLLLMCLTFGLLTACGADKTESTTAKLMISVKTEDGDRKPVPTVRFYINGQKYGITLEDGRAKDIEYSAKIGDTVTFDVEEPDGYRVPMAIDRTQWKHVVTEIPIQPVHFNVTFERPERDYVFLVDVEGDKQAVTLNGKRIGSTSETGEAILKVRGYPRQKFTVTAGSVVLKNAVFADGPEVYVVSGVRVGPVGKTTRLEATPVQVAVKTSVANTEKTSRIPTMPPSRKAATRTPRKRRTKQDARPIERKPQPVRSARTSPRPAARVKSARRRGANTSARAGAAVVVGIPTRPPVAAARVEPPKPERAREPAREVVRPVAKKSKPAPVDSAINDLLDDDIDEAPPTRRESAREMGEPPKPVTPAPVVVAVAKAKMPVRSQPDGRSNTGSGSLDDLIDDDTKTVARDAVNKRVSISASTGTGSGNLDKTQIRARIADIKERLNGTQVINRGDAEFLRTVSRKDRTSYYEANRLLGHWYFKLKDYGRQAKALEEATRSGKYKHDPQILLSLAKAYGRQKKYSKAVRAMRRVESKMGRMRNKTLKSDAYRFYAEMLEFDFLRQYNDDAKEANYGLLNRAIRQWEKYRNFNRGVSTGSVREAEGKIEKLGKLKRELEY